MYMVKCNDHAFDLESTATDLENSFSTTKVQNEEREREGEKKRGKVREKEEERTECTRMNIGY